MCARFEGVKRHTRRLYDGEDEATVPLSHIDFLGGAHPEEHHPLHVMHQFHACYEGKSDKGTVVRLK